ncbi:MAG TPA: sulfite exporter TauE/SafE family protein [Gammaproteobacteria bacterium]|nr:sulfite exporter TauE/SafE family protein [Gammaproteobacteria bacterium]
MMTFVIGLFAFLASLLTLFSGFGLGTLLMPVVAIFFPLPIAIAITALVHLLNNCFKLILLRKKADWGVTFQFGIPGIFGALLGAWLLSTLTLFSPWYSYTLFNISAQIEPLKIIIGLLIILFATLEWVVIKISFVIHRKWLPVGGVLSGFLGGLSGLQGAFRAPFLMHASLNQEEFVGTNTSIAILVDATRLLVYGFSFHALANQVPHALLLITVISAFFGATLGIYFLKRVTFKLIRGIMLVLLYLLGTLLVSGIL